MQGRWTKEKDSQLQLEGKKKQCVNLHLYKSRHLNLWLLGHFEIAFEFSVHVCDKTNNDLHFLTRESFGVAPEVTLEGANTLNCLFCNFCF